MQPVVTLLVLPGCKPARTGLSPFLSVILGDAAHALDPWCVHTSCACSSFGDVVHFPSMRRLPYLVSDIQGIRWKTPSPMGG